MRPIRLLFIYLLAVFVGGALLAPWLYALVQSGAMHFALLRDLAENPFYRYVHRTMLLIAVIGLWPLSRSLGMNSRAALGLGQGAPDWGNLNKGFWLGFGSLALVAGINLAAGARKIDLDHSALAVLQRIFSVALTAAVVAILEEIVFRGALFGALRRAHKWSAALVLSSLVYALVHFFSKPPSPETIDWTSGLFVLGGMLLGFADLQALIPGFLTLTVAGVILGLAYQRSGNLFMSIGLHAGWIFWLKFYGFLTQPVSGVSTWFWGTGKLVNGCLALIVLTLLLTMLWLQPQPAASRISEIKKDDREDQDRESPANRAL